jgi:hypothetical protein
MPINRTQLEARLEELKTQAEQLKQQYLAVSGAVSDVEYWLAEDAKLVEDLTGPKE